MVLHGPKAEGQIGEELRRELDERLFLDRGGQGIETERRGDGQEREGRAPFFCLSRCGVRTRPWLHHGGRQFSWKL